MKNFYHRNNCRLCNASDLELVVPMKPSPIADAYVSKERLSEVQELFPLDLYLCRDCGHVQLLDVVRPEILFRDYTYTTSISLGLVEHFRNYANAVVNLFPSERDSLAFDIGSNDGTLLRFFKEKGFRVLGVDPAVRIAIQATAQGVETIPEFFSAELARDFRKRYGPARFVTANNVFAHSDNLPDIADGVREMLAPDGVFVFEVSYLVDIVEKLLIDTVYHEHLCYHSIKPLVSFLSRHGLELIDVHRMPTKGGSIRGFAQKKNGPYVISARVTELLAKEEAIGLDKPAVFQNLAGRIETTKNDVLVLLTKLKSENKIIAGYGASATVTTLLYNFELGGLLDFLVDDNVSRHGLFSPGYHIPVHPPQVLIERNADFCVLAAWQYAEPILRKNTTFKQRGGQFILPMPKLEVI